MLAHLFRLFPAQSVSLTLRLGDVALRHLNSLNPPALIPELAMVFAALKGGLTIPPGPSAKSPCNIKNATQSLTKSSQSASDATASTRMAIRQHFLGILHNFSTVQKNATSFSQQNLYYFSTCTGLTNLLLGSMIKDGSKQQLQDPRVAGIVFGAATQCFRCVASAAAHEVSAIKVVNFPSVIDSYLSFYFIVINKQYPV